MSKRLFNSMAAFFLIISLCLTGCGADSSKADTSSYMAAGIPAITESFDFFNAPNGYESISMAQVYDNLIRKGADGTYIPGLADSYETDDKAQTFTFYLNKNALWTDGTPVTSDDVAFSMEQLKNSEYVSYIYKPLLDSVETPDDYTVVIHLKKPSVSFLEYLANPYYSAILSRKAYEKYGENYGTSVDTIVSSGPYQVKEWNVGSSIKYEVNPKYYRDLPDIKNTELIVMHDGLSAMMALQTGEIDAYFDDVPGVSREMMSNRDDIHLYDYTSTILYCIFFNTQNGLFSNPDVRKAVALAINKQNFVIVGAEGYGQTADYPGDRGNIGDPKLHGIWDETYGQNLEQAKELIEQAGVKGKSVEIKTYSTSPYPELATVLQDALTQIGLNATVAQEERAAFIDQVLDNGDFDIQICRWAAATEDMDEIIYGSLHSDSVGAPGNWSFYSSSQLDSLITEASGESNPSKRENLYQTIVNLFVEDCIFIPLFYPTSSRAYQADFSIKDGLQKYDLFAYYSQTEENNGNE